MSEFLYNFVPMKRLLSLLVVALFAVQSHPLKAQGFEVGVRSGANLASLIGIDQTTPRTGFYGGITSSLFLTERFGVTLDVTLSEQGVCCNPNEEGVAIDYRYDYLNIPLMATYRIPLGGGSSLRLLAGGQLGVFMLGTYSYTAPSVLGEGTVSGSGVMDKEDFHPFDFGISLGAQWVLWGEHVLIEARYTIGLNQTHDGVSNTFSDYYYISVPNNRNSVIQIGTALLF